MHTSINHHLMIYATSTSTTVLSLSPAAWSCSSLVSKNALVSVFPVAVARALTFCLFLLSHHSLLILAHFPLKKSISVLLKHVFSLTFFPFFFLLLLHSL